MKKGFGLVGILIIVGIIAVGGGGYYLLKNTNTQTKCQEFQNDVCGLFDCMVSSCWCNDSGSSPILWETHISFDNEKGAKDAVNVYIAELINDDDKLYQKKLKK